MLKARYKGKTIKGCQEIELLGSPFQIQVDYIQVQTTERFIGVLITNDIILNG